MTRIFKFIKKNKIGIIVAALAGVGILFFISLFVLAILAEMNGYSIDPTDPINFFTIAIHNDTPNTLKVTWVNKCVSWGDRDKCAHGWNIPPNNTVQDTAQRGSSEQYTVSDQSGKLLGCLNVSETQSEMHGTLTINTSQITACGKDNKSN